jgi:hypothetical protein
MAAPKPEKNYWAIKSAVGSLFKAVTLSTDPAQTLSFSSSLINTTRSFLIQKLEERVPDSDQIPFVINAILKTTVEHWDGRTLTNEGVMEMDRAIDTIFKSTSMARYGLQIYRDILYCDNLNVRWAEANNVYVQTHQSWIISNAMLAKINQQLLEIIVRHDLMTFPKGEVFNMDDIGSNMGRLMKRMNEGDEVGGES